MESGLKFPEALKTGDTIAIVSPAFPIKAEERDLCIKKIEEIGYKVKLGTCLEQMYNFHNYLAGDAESRAEDLNRMFADPEVKAIFCARGGYGSSHIMQYLDYGLIAHNPKIFVGYSDITNLHTALSMFCGFVSFHGPMAQSNIMSHFDTYTADSLRRTLSIKEGELLKFENPAEMDGFHIITPGKAQGILAGGNLAVLARACGTFYQLKGEGRIIFLEDVSESVPALDMYITQLEYAGVFKGARGVLLGNFTDCTNKYDTDYNVDLFLQERFSGYGIPVMSHIQSGHERPMGTLPMGAVCTMDADTAEISFSRHF